MKAVQTDLDVICATNNVCASVLVLKDLELKAIPVSMHLVQCLLQAVLLAGIHADGLQCFQLGCNTLVKEILHRERVPDALLTLLDGTLIVLDSSCVVTETCKSIYTSMLD